MGCSNSQARVQRAHLPTPPRRPQGNVHTVLGRYEVGLGADSVMGEGSSSICRRGLDSATGRPVAVKVYKSAKQGGPDASVDMARFRRQVKVLQELQKPFAQPADPSLWDARMEAVPPSKLFMQLLDYSKDEKGQPGPGEDGQMYLITELADCSLRDFVRETERRGERVPPVWVRDIAKAMIQVVAGLHAKRLVHLDLKPHNLMLFGGRLKLIDVEGCVKAGATVFKTDPFISYSTSYCAPEWAQFILNESASEIRAWPSLDVWSVGMTIAEVVLLRPPGQEEYRRLQALGVSREESRRSLLQWQASSPRVHLARDSFDPRLRSLLSRGLLAPDPNARPTMAQCLSHPYFADP